jgi:ABC-type nitrate/sulfonate/bicarbonate transport system substrate-binding protein
MNPRQSFFVPPAPYVIAEARGLLAAAGVSVESHRTRSSGEQLDGLVNGRIDLAITAMDNVFVWNQRGADLRIVAQIEQTTLLTVYGQPGTRTLSELARGRFAVDAMTNGFSLVARRLLEDAGVTASFIEVGGVKERFDALTAGTVDGTLLGPPFDELAEHAGMVALASANASLPGLAGQGVVVRAQRRDAETAALSAYLGVLNRAIAEAEGLSDEEGIALFERNGFPGRSASDAWRTRPRSIVVEPGGIAFLESLRGDFGLLPDGYTGLAGVLDNSLTEQLPYAS